jgi:glycosyltransferase involved in cell wall biosynthesis
MHMNNLFQVIVPVFNEEATLEKILSCAKENDYLKHIVFVDDASTDSSLKIIRKWAACEAILAISLKNNRKKEGAIRAALEVLAQQR